MPVLPHKKRKATLSELNAWSDGLGNVLHHKITHGAPEGEIDRLAKQLEKVTDQRKETQPENVKDRSEDFYRYGNAPEKRKGGRGDNVGPKRIHIRKQDERQEGYVKRTPNTEAEENMPVDRFKKRVTPEAFEVPDEDGIDLSNTRIR